MYSAFIHMHPMAVWLSDLESLQIIEANRAARDLLGNDSDALSGLTMDALCTATDLPHLQARLDEVRRGEPFCDVIRWITRSRGVADMVVSGLPVKVNRRPHVLIIIHDDSKPLADGAMISAMREGVQWPGLQPPGELWQTSPPAVAVKGATPTGEEDRAVTWGGWLHQVIETMAEGFVALGPELRIGYLNLHAEMMLGQSRDVLIGKSLPMLLSDGSAAACRDAALRVMEHNGVEVVEAFIAATQTWCRLQLVPTAEGIAIHMQDVTAEMAHAKRLQLLEAAVDGQNDALEITEVAEGTEDGKRLIYVNAAFERVTGYTSSEAIGRSPLLHNGPLTSQDELRRIETALDAGAPVLTEIVNYRKDGSTYLKEADLRPIRDVVGRVTHWVASSRDITAQRAIESALRQSEERFRLVALATRDVVWDRDIRLNKVWWNEALFQIFGYDHTAPEIQAPEWWPRLVHPKDADRIVSSFEASLAGSETTWEDAYRMLRSNGTYAHVTDRAHISRDAEGHVVRAVGCIADVTAQVETAAKMKKAQKLEAFTQLTGGIAHDFNNLLTVIVGNAELLAEDHDIAAHHANMAKTVMLAAEGGSKLTSELLSFAREQAISPRKVDLNKLLEEMQPELRRAVANDRTITMNSGAGLWLIEVDPDQFKSSVLNMVRNADDAMSPGGTLIIETRNHRMAPSGSDTRADADGDGYVQLTVRDDGTGIPAELIDRIFEPFFTTRPTGKGRGLGLSVVHGFVAQSGGYIQVDSQPGQGTEFCLFFPRAGLSLSDGAIGRQRVPAARGTEHVLLVEDDPMVASYVRGQMEELGYRVTAAANAADALGLMAVHQDIDLLFTDIVMPGTINGWQLAETVARLRPLVRVLLTSGYSDAAFAASGTPNSSVCLLEKPYRRHELAARLRDALGR